MAPRACSLRRFAAAVLLVLAAAMVALFDTAAATSSDDPCVVLDQACKADDVCLACQQVVGTNLEAFEECQLNYGWSDDICVNQSAQPCCQNEASASDCLSNVAYVDFYECRLSNDVFEGGCTELNCEAVAGFVSPTPSPGATQAPTTIEDDDTEANTSENSTGRLTPSFLTIPSGNAGFLMTALYVAAAAAVATASVS